MNVMRLEGHVYRALIVSPGERFTELIRPLLQECGCETIDYAGSVASARRVILEREYDFVLINAPLPDEQGNKLAIDVSTSRTTICMIAVKSEIYGSACIELRQRGVFVLAKPTNATALRLAINWLVSARERLRGAAQKTVSLEEKMEEIRIVNRAKWLLIEQMHLTEPEAHRLIEKQAMDLCVSKREVADRILKTYLK